LDDDDEKKTIEQLDNALLPNDKADIISLDEDDDGERKNQKS